MTEGCLYYYQMCVKLNRRRHTSGVFLIIFFFCFVHHVSGGDTHDLQLGPAATLNTYILCACRSTRSHIIQQVYHTLQIYLLRSSSRRNPCSSFRGIKFNIIVERPSPPPRGARSATTDLQCFTRFFSFFWSSFLRTAKISTCRRRLAVHIATETWLVPHILYVLKKNIYYLQTTQTINITIYNTTIYQIEFTKENYYFHQKRGVIEKKIYYIGK